MNINWFEIKDNFPKTYNLLNQKFDEHEIKYNICFCDLKKFFGVYKDESKIMYKLFEIYEKELK